MSDHRWRQLAALGQRQHGLSSTSQIRAIGYSEQELRTLLSRDLITRIERGLYRITGHHPDWRATLLAHCWATQGRAFSASAAILHGLGSPGDLSPGFAEVVVPTALRPRTRNRLSIERSCQWDRIGTVVVDQIPVIPLPATLVSLAMHHRFEVFRAATNAARRHHRVTLEQIQFAATTFLATGIRHAQTLRCALERLGDEPTLSLSDWSDDFADWCRSIGFPPPILEHRITDHAGVLIGQVDLCWPELGVVVELDSWAWHHDRSSFDRDRDRYRQLTARGWKVLAITWTQWTSDRVGIARDLAAALDQPNPLAATDTHRNR